MFPSRSQMEKTELEKVDLSPDGRGVAGCQGI